LDHTDKIPEEIPAGNTVDSAQGENADLEQRDDENIPESNNAEEPLLVKSYTSSGSSIETVVAEMIKQADNTGIVVQTLYTVHRYHLYVVPGPGTLYVTHIVLHI
jgi:hypothetical protein